MKGLFSAFKDDRTKRNYKREKEGKRRLSLEAGALDSL